MKLIKVSTPNILDMFSSFMVLLLSATFRYVFRHSNLFRTDPLKFQIYSTIQANRDSTLALRCFDAFQSFSFVVVFLKYLIEFGYDQKVSDGSAHIQQN